MSLGICFNMLSDPTLTDSDGDGYNDKEDLAPMKPYRTPVILLHGRGDNSKNCFGITTNIDSGDNQNYNSDVTNNGLSYTNIDSQYINEIKLGDKEETNLGITLTQNNYIKNKNLFVFNYPNFDFTNKNADKLKTYIENLVYSTCYIDIKNKSYFFPTYNDYNNINYKFNLIGHSNGGLVARYYIENLYGDKNVEKLITIDTPHFGSSLANADVNVSFVTGTILLGAYICPPMDVDLSQYSLMFGGSKVYLPSIINGYDAAYINNHQTNKLNGNAYHSISTKYYFISGLNISDKYLNNEIISCNINLPNIPKQSIAYHLQEVLRKYKNNIVIVENDIDNGDNVINLYTQLGYQYDQFNNFTSKVLSEKSAVIVCSDNSLTVTNSFHNKTLKLSATMNKVKEFLND